jgi:hypothetical protein
MGLLSYAKLPMLSQVEAVLNLSTLYDIYGLYEVISKTNYKRQMSQKPKELQQNLFSNFFLFPH